MGSKKKQTVGYKYYLGMHLALTHGPIDKFRDIKFDDKIAWAGDQQSGKIYVNKAGLFGGEDREGGVGGFIDLESGSATQDQNAYLASKLGALVPAFRGVVCAVLNQFYVGMSSYLKLCSFRLQRIHTRQSSGIAQWYDDKAEIAIDTEAYPAFIATIPTLKTIPLNPQRLTYSFDGVYLRSLEVTNGFTGQSVWTITDKRYNSAGTLVYNTTFNSPVLPDPNSLPSLVYTGAELMWFHGAPETFGQVIWGAGNTGVTAINSRLATYGGITPLFNFSALTQLGSHGIAATPFDDPFNAGMDYAALAAAYSYPFSCVATKAGLFAIAYDWWTTLGTRLVKYDKSGTLLAYAYLGYSSYTSTVFTADENGHIFALSWPVTSLHIREYDENLVLVRTYTNALTDLSFGYPYLGAVVYSNHIMLCGPGDTPGGYKLFLYRMNLGSLTVTQVGTPLTLGTENAPSLYSLGNGLAFCYGQIVRMFSWKGQRDMNPAHIIRECLTDPDWGMGYPDADIDDTSFMAAADTLYSEGMGMSLLWDRQIPLEDFVKEVLKHIDAALYVDRATGKFVLKLVRADYVEGDLLVLDESNVESIDNPTTTTFGELANSITVNFWDYKTGKTGSVTVDDPAMIQMQGAVINTTMQYTGFSNSAIAARVAQRDLRSLSTPLLSCTITANRDAKDLNLGDAFKLNWPDLEIDNVVMRVTGLDLGDGRSNKVRITAGQDVFAMPLSGVISEEEAGSWEDPSTEPVPPTMQMAIEAPFYEVVQRKGDEETATELAAHPERGYLLIACNRPAGSAIYAETYVDSGAGFEDAGKTDFCPSATLLADVTPQATTFTLANGSDLSSIAVGTHGQIDNEIFKVISINTAVPSMVVGRGCLDTCPRAHLAGASILFWDVYATGDNVEYVSGETVNALVLPTTGLGTLDQEDAITSQVVMAGRAIKPYAPGNFKINAAYFPTVIRGNTSLALTWAHRDRTQQTAGDIITFTDGSIGPEAGVTYNVYLYKETGVLGKTFTGLTAESLTYTMATEATEMGISGRANGKLRIVVEAERAGHKSYQTQDWTVDRAGYGFQYGKYYGGI